MSESDLAYFQYPMHWNNTQDAEFPYRATVDNQLWILRINDFPDHALYTLIIQDREIRDFDDWPPSWSR